MLCAPIYRYGLCRFKLISKNEAEENTLMLAKIIVDSSQVSVLFVCIYLLFFTHNIVITEEYGGKGEGRPMHCS